MKPSKKKIGTLVKAIIVATVLLAGVACLAPAASAQPLGGFRLTGDMATPREESTFTLLTNGKALVTGGWDYDYGAITTSEIYDPATGGFSPAGKMIAAGRGCHSATLLANGKVLIAGGYNDFVGDLASAELYDPSTGTFTATGNLTRARCSHSATLLHDGKVLITGGDDTRANVGIAEIYDPAAGTFTEVGPMTKVRHGHVATLLVNGKVLLAGGYGGDTFTARAELYDPTLPRPAISPQKPARDFNHEGKTDVLWRDTAGNVSIWEMNGATVVAKNFISSIWPGWSIVGSGDFDGDGRSDILWRDTSGNVAIWLMDGTTTTSNRSMGNVSDRQAQ